MFSLSPEDVMHYNADKDRLDILPGKVDLMIGPSSQDIKLKFYVVIKNE